MHFFLEKLCEYCRKIGSVVEILIAHHLCLSEQTHNDEVNSSPIYMLGEDEQQSYYLNFTNWMISVRLKHLHNKLLL